VCGQIIQSSGPPRATSCRNTGRDHLGTLGRLPRNPHTLPVDGFYEWEAIKWQRAKQPYAIAMKDGSPFGIAGLWENWKDLASGKSISVAVMLVVSIENRSKSKHSHSGADWPQAGPGF
jgi:hypothetical protein